MEVDAAFHAWGRAALILLTQSPPQGAGAIAFF